ncbi:unnamed protein product [Orchesella dallaii]|uniref:Uncharacterized protein n=1 Tax=Orchesella dallaii TaxID=48710 RepID=A0ABP1RHT0_9HEXA
MVKFIVSLLLCGSSLSVVLVRNNGELLYGWEEYIIHNAENAMSLFCFSTFCKQVKLDPSSVGTIALSLLGWTTQLAGTLYGQVARDGVVFSALTLGKCAMAFRFKHRLADKHSTTNNAVGTDILTEFELIKKISKRISSAFNGVFRFFLLANIFMFAVFMDDWFNPSLEKLAKGVKLMEIVLVCVTFYYANQAAKVGDRFSEWIKIEKNRNLLGLSQIDVLMENSSNSSIGYGRGALFIYDATLIGFASVVAAYFLGIVETRPQYNMRQGIENPFSCGNVSNYI